tara:strand:- start:280 stop:1119 length:840 start_codon:yes stop_codon:yes gene_type:complete
MSFKNITIETIGLHVGESQWNVPKQGILSKAGTLTCSGMSIFGDCSDVGGVATVTIGTADKDSLQKNMKLSLNVRGNSVLQGDSQTPNALHVSGGGSVNTVYIDGDLYVSGSTDTGNKGRLASRFGTADALPPKPFDIKHPTKGDGWRLRYVSLEGPESAVFYRGRTRTNKITLPYYWKDLVHVDSITVEIQPIGHPQNIIVKEFDNERIIIDSENTWIDCFFHVYGERKDVNPLLTEYEGNNRYDYPDPNFSEDSDIPLEERNYTDPKYNFPRNTITS